jgi:aminopeptidase-like protein
MPFRGGLAAVEGSDMSSLPSQEGRVATASAPGPLPSLAASGLLSDTAGLGSAMYALISDLYPFCRSITGEGVRQTLARLRRDLPLAVEEVPTGTQVFDWTVPREWNIRDAWVKDSHGRRVIDFRASNLHVLGYSVPVRATLSLSQLREHLITLPEHPDWIPYRTSYYREHWAFCISHRQFLELKEDTYEVCIDSSLAPGSLTYGELYLPGALPDEVLISTHICHPSLCNDNLSGIALAACLARSLGGVPHRYSYRFLFVPATIGSITWLARNQDRLSAIRHGLVVVSVGDSGAFTYKQSRRGDAPVDRAAAHVLRHSGHGFRVVPFSPYGYDERQYCSPGIDLPLGCFSRSPHGSYPQYHTSADNLDFVQPRFLAESFECLVRLLEVLENDRRYLNLNPKCEPQLGRRGLYGSLGALPGGREQAEMAMLWVLSFSDGDHSLLDISERAGLPFAAVLDAARMLEHHHLLRELGS